MPLLKSFGAKSLAVALALTFAPATMPSGVVVPGIGVGSANAQTYSGDARIYHVGNHRWRGNHGRHYNRHYSGRRHYNRHRGSNAAAAAVIGGIVGLGIGAAIASQPRYVEPRRYYRAAPTVVYASPRPWTRDWYRYCASKYRSFDARSGTYQPYNGPRRLCH